MTCIASFRVFHDYAVLESLYARICILKYLEVKFIEVGFGWRVHELRARWTATVIICVCILLCASLKRAIFLFLGIFDLFELIRIRQLVLPSVRRLDEQLVVYGQRCMLVQFEELLLVTASYRWPRLPDWAVVRRAERCLDFLGSPHVGAEVTIKDIHSVQINLLRGTTASLWGFDHAWREVSIEDLLVSFFVMVVRLDDFKGKILGGILLLFSFCYFDVQNCSRFLQIDPIVLLFALLRVWKGQSFLSLVCWYRIAFVILEYSTFRFFFIQWLDAFRPLGNELGLCCNPVMLYRLPFTILDLSRWRIVHFWTGCLPKVDGSIVVPPHLALSCIVNLFPLFKGWVDIEGSTSSLWLTVDVR